MSRRPTQYGTAQVKQKDAVRPLLVLLLIGGGGIALFLWLQADTVDPLVAVAPADAQEDGSASEPAIAKEAQIPDAGEDLEDWWYDVETRLLEAFESLDAAKQGSCDDLEYGVADLGSISPRKEPPVRSPYSAIVVSLDRAVTGCRSGNSAIVEGSGRSAREQLRTLTDALRVYGLPPSSLLSEI